MTYRHELEAKLAQLSKMAASRRRERREYLLCMAARQFGALSMFDYDVIVADPPWDFEHYSDAGTKKVAVPHYAVMPLEAIKALRCTSLRAAIACCCCGRQAGPTRRVRPDLHLTRQSDVGLFSLAWKNSTR
jgi:hypothetical protein